MRIHECMTFICTWKRTLDRLQSRLCLLCDPLKVDRMNFMRYSSCLKFSIIFRLGRDPLIHILTAIPFK